jgi:hypothetical protein
MTETSMSKTLRAMPRGLRALVVAPVLVLAACATVPSGPSVMVLPGTSKTFDAFQADSFACQQFASTSLGLGPPGAAVPEQNAANAAVAATLIGAAAGAAIGSISGQAGQGAAIGAGTGLLFGGTNAAYAGGYASYDWQRRYDNAYVQCMYAKGNQVPVRAGYRSGMPSVLRSEMPAG